MNCKSSRRIMYILRILGIEVLLLCLLAGGGTSGSKTVQASSAASAPEFTEFSDLSGKKVSMLTGAPFEELILSKVPDVGEFFTYNNNPDMILALKSGKTDAFLSNNAVGTLAVNRDPELALFPQDLDTGVFGIAFAKDDPRRDDWKKAYDSIPQTVITALWEKWTGSDDSIKTMPDQDWPGRNGTVQAAVCDTLEPMSYTGKGGQLMGFDIELILLMAKELDVHVEFTGMDFSGVLSALQAGKVLLGAGSIIATQERRQSVDFVDYYPAAFVLVVRAVQTPMDAEKTVSELSQFEHAKIGVTTGSIQTQQVEERFPDAEIYYFSTDVDMLNALRTKKIDAFSSAEALVRYMMTESPDLTCLDEKLSDGMQAGAVFAKTDSGQALCSQFSAFILEIKQNGVYDEIQETWFGEDEDKRVVPDLDKLPDPNGTLKMAADTSFVPFVFIKDRKPVGIDVDTVVRFCKEYGYGLEIVPMDFSGIIPAVVSGKVDFACGGIAYTPERAESVLYSEPTYESASVIAVLKQADSSEGGGFWSSILDSFQKTFIRENRWMLFIQGIVTTLLITVLSIIFGTALGFLVFMICRKGNPIANKITKFCVWLVQGMPVVVLLMILYYIIFSKVALSGTAISVVGFTLVFGSCVYSMLKAGVGAVDPGQMEAASSLGYTDRKAFFRVILPQALPHFMPSYKGEITALIKATAVVGYVAVQDLTKMGDIIRSRTYEAFFPLIAVAIIYFILAAILIFIVKRIEIRINPRRRSKEHILKGVNVK